MPMKEEEGIGMASIQPDIGQSILSELQKLNGNMLQLHSVCNAVRNTLDELKNNMCDVNDAQSMAKRRKVCVTPADTSNNTNGVTTESQAQTTYSPSAAGRRKSSPLWNFFIDTGHSAKCNVYNGDGQRCAFERADKHNTNLEQHLRRTHADDGSHAWQQFCMLRAKQTQGHQLHRKYMMNNMNTNGLNMANNINNAVLGNTNANNNNRATTNTTADMNCVSTSDSPISYTDDNSLSQNQQVQSLQTAAAQLFSQPLAEQQQATAALIQMLQQAQSMQQNTLNVNGKELHMNGDNEPGMHDDDASGNHCEDTNDIESDDTSTSPATDGHNANMNDSNPNMNDSNPNGVMPPPQFKTNNGSPNSDQSSFACHFCPATFGSPSKAQRHAMDAHNSMSYGNGGDNSQSQMNVSRLTPTAHTNSTNNNSNTPNTSLVNSAQNGSANSRGFSRVWLWFTYKADIHKSQCQLCNIELAGKYTSNLQKHLRSAHPGAYAQMRAGQTHDGGGMNMGGAGTEPINDNSSMGAMGGLSNNALIQAFTNQLFNTTLPITALD